MPKGKSEHSEQYSIFENHWEIRRIFTLLIPESDS
jgi:hypothetical protein